MTVPYIAESSQTLQPLLSAKEIDRTITEGLDSRRKASTPLGIVGLGDVHSDPRTTNTPTRRVFRDSYIPVLRARSGRTEGASLGAPDSCTTAIIHSCG